MSIPVACTVAGSDSSGGAGIQADLKTFAALGVYGTSAIVALTAQNTVGVRAVQAASPELITGQIDAVTEDLHPVAWKTGMLATADVIQLVAERLGHHHVPNLVVDPVMVAKSGDRLLAADAVTALKQVLLPLATVVTPNLREAEELVGHPVVTLADARRAAPQIAASGPRFVVVKGGHGAGDPVIDVVFNRDRDEVTELSYPRIPGTSDHGTGCTFSAAIAAHLAHGADPVTAISEARVYLQQTLAWAPGLGSGHGPLGHFGPPGTAPVSRQLSAPRPAI